MRRPALLTVNGIAAAADTCARPDNMTGCTTKSIGCCKSEFPFRNDLVKPSSWRHRFLAGCAAPTFFFRSLFTGRRPSNFAFLNLPSRISIFCCAHLHARPSPAVSYRSC